MWGGGGDKKKILKFRGDFKSSGKAAALILSCIIKILSHFKADGGGYRVWWIWARGAELERLEKQTPVGSRILSCKH